MEKVAAVVVSRDRRHEPARDVWRDSEKVAGSGT